MNITPASLKTPRRQDAKTQSFQAFYSSPLPTGGFPLVQPRPLSRSLNGAINTGQQAVQSGFSQRRRSTELKCRSEAN